MSFSKAGEYEICYSSKKNVKRFEDVFTGRCFTSKTDLILPDLARLMAGGHS